MYRIAALIAVAAALVGLTFVRPNTEQLPSPPLPAVSWSSGDALRLKASLSGRYVVNHGEPNYLTIDVSTPERVTTVSADRNPVNLAVVIDRSGSMQGAKMAAAKRAASHLVSLLSERDRLAIIEYGSGVHVFASQLASADGKAQMQGFIERIYAEGSTYLSGGVEAGAAALTPHLESYRTNRVILLSDGQPTVGLTTAADLQSLIGGIRERGVTVTALGVGADFDARLMQALAETGGGFYGDLEHEDRLSNVFEREFQAATALIARDVNLELQLPEGVAVDEVLGRQVTRQGRNVSLKLHDFSAGLSTRVVVKLSVNYAATSSAVALGTARLSYRDVSTGNTDVATVAFQGEVTESAQLAMQNASPEILQHAMRAEAAKEMERAAQQLHDGRRADAAATLSNGLARLHSLFGMSADALAGDMVVDSNTSSQTARKLSQKSLMGFGKNNAY